MPNKRPEDTYKIRGSSRGVRLGGASKKTCRQCGISLERRYSETKSKFELRAYCSAKCSRPNQQRFNNFIAPAVIRHPEPRACRNCGGPVVQRPGEHPGNFERRVCCSRTCATAIKKMHFDTPIPPGWRPDRKIAAIEEGRNAN